MKGTNSTGVKPGNKENQINYWNGSAWQVLDPGSQSQVLTMCDNKLVWTDGGKCVAKVKTLECESVSFNGYISKDGYPVDYFFGLKYTGGNGGVGSFSQIASEGVTGLTAYLTNNFVASDNELKYSVTGSTSGQGFATFNIQIGSETCQVKINTPPHTACWQTATLNENSGVWEVSGTQPAQPTLVCYQNAKWLESTCQWIVTGDKPAQPNVACYETATWNSSSCQWDVTGSQPTQPNVNCGETVNWNEMSCQWDIINHNPQPNVACYETVTWNTNTCQWDVTGSQPVQTSTNAVWNSSNCQWLPTSGYGDDINDIGGNTYKTVYIGTQQWMAENLKVSKYNDETIIDNTQWNYNTTAAWAYCNNDVANNAKYGKLYNWYAVSKTSNGNKNICPTGWHVPTDAEWTVLTDYLGGESVAGGKMKEVGTTNWNSPNTDATNTSLFTGLPGGVRFNNGDFIDINSSGNWWSSLESNITNALTRYFYYSNGKGSTYAHNKLIGMSIRCLRD